MTGFSNASVKSRQQGPVTHKPSPVSHTNNVPSATQPRSCQPHKQGHVSQTNKVPSPTNEVPSATQARSCQPHKQGSVSHTNKVLSATQTKSRKPHKQCSVSHINKVPSATNKVLSEKQTGLDIPIHWSPRDAQGPGVLTSSRRARAVPTRAKIICHNRRSQRAFLPH